MIETSNPVEGGRVIGDGGDVRGGGVLGKSRGRFALAFSALLFACGAKDTASSVAKSLSLPGGTCHEEYSLLEDNCSRGDQRDQDAVCGQFSDYMSCLSKSGVSVSLSTQKPYVYCGEDGFRVRFPGESKGIPALNPCPKPNIASN